MFFCHYKWGMGLSCTDCKKWELVNCKPTEGEKDGVDISKGSGRYDGKVRVDDKGVGGKGRVSGFSGIESVYEVVYRQGIAKVAERIE